MSLWTIKLYTGMSFGEKAGGGGRLSPLILKIVIFGVFAHFFSSYFALPSLPLGSRSKCAHPPSG